MKFNFTLLFFVSCSLLSFKIQSQELLISNQASNRGSAYTMQNKIISVIRDGRPYEYFGFVERSSSNGLYPVKILEYNVETGSKNFIWIGDIQDQPTPDNPHGGPSLTLDKNGFLHVVFGPHYDVVRYRKSQQSLYNYSLLLKPEETIPNDLKSDNDKWTYPIIKIDDSETIHVAGSLDAIPSNGNEAKDIGYVRKKKNGIWEYPLQNGDSLGIFNPTYFARYDVMMNIDNDNIIHILAPDGNANPEYDLDYDYFTSTDGGDSFVKNVKAWEQDLEVSQGKGNIAMDSNNQPHFTLYAGNVQRGEFIYHNYYDGHIWNKEALSLNDKYLHEPKLRIDDYECAYLLFYSTNQPSWVSTPSTLQIARKKLYDENAEFEIFDFSENTGSGLVWMSTIEEQSRYINFEKNWFFVMWQENPSGLASEPQMIKAKMAMSEKFQVPDKKFNSHIDFRAGDLISVGDSISDSQPTDKAELSSSVEARFTSGDRIKLSPGFGVSYGATFHASIDDTLEGLDSQDNLVSQGSNTSYTADFSNFKVTSETSKTFLFPNPNRGKFKIVVPKSIASEEMSIRIFDSAGRLVHEQNIDGRRSTVKTKTLPSGIYHLKIMNTGDVVEEKSLIIK